MRSPLLLLPTVLLCLALAACHRSPAVQLPDPNPVGQWQWSNPVLGSWHLEIKADGTFRRETTDRVARDTISTGGRWTLTVNQSKPTFLERHQVFQKTSAEEDFLRKAGIEGVKRNSIQLSAPGSFSLFYYLPKDGERSPGAVWTSPTLAEAVLGPAPAGAVGMEEKRTLRTFTDTGTGEVFLDLEGKTFRKSIVTFSGKDLPPNGETRDYAGSDTTVQPATHTDFLTIEAFLGIALDLPKEWQAFNPETPTKPAVPLSALASHPHAPRPGSSWRFMPPGLPEENYVVLSMQAPTFTAQQLADASQDDLDRFALGYVKTAAHELEPNGYFLQTNVTAERVHIGRLSAILCSGQAVDPRKSLRTIRVYTIPTGAGTVLLTCCWDPEADPPWKPVIERISSSLRVAEGFRLTGP